MRKFFLLIMLATLVFSACNSSKSTSASNVTENEKTMKANLIDGTWEANYIMNSPKPFGELYNLATPVITFNSVKHQVSGITGCNNFNGTFSVNGNKISFQEAMALTRKMCPDMAGEKLFLETLKKVNSYSVTEQGKTLNLIMGDMAVLRLSRK